MTCCVTVHRDLSRDIASNAWGDFFFARQADAVLEAAPDCAHKKLEAGTRRRIRNNPRLRNESARLPAERLA